MISTIPMSIISVLVGWITHVLHMRVKRKEKKLQSGTAEEAESIVSGNEGVDRPGKSRGRVGQPEVSPIN
jgi:hypothetical protein